jgi:hypothetical protein
MHATTATFASLPRARSPGIVCSKNQFNAMFHVRPESRTMFRYTGLRSPTRVGSNSDTVG